MWFLIGAAALAAALLQLLLADNVTAAVAFGVVSLMGFARPFIFGD